MMRRTILVVATVLCIASCKPENERDIFYNESSVGECDNLVIIPSPARTPDNSTDYIYEASLRNVHNCKSFDTKALEKDGFLCKRTKSGASCPKLFEDGSIAQLTVSEDMAFFRRVHNR